MTTPVEAGDLNRLIRQVNKDVSDASEEAPLSEVELVGGEEETRLRSSHPEELAALLSARG